MVGCGEDKGYGDGASDQMVSCEAIPQLLGMIVHITLAFSFSILWQHSTRLDDSDLEYC